MQSSKTSKKPSKAAEKPPSASAESAPPVAEVSSKSRSSKPSTTKTGSSKTGRATHRKTIVAEPKAVRATESLVIDPVGVMTPAPEGQEVTDSHVADLAYSYWIARDYAHGFAEEDWHRAERELKQKR